jgi:pimeloyl-ACP methyl ester carboxylesterase
MKTDASSTANPGGMTIATRSQLPSAPLGISFGKAKRELSRSETGRFKDEQLKSKKDSQMPRIMTRDGVELYVKVWGAGRPVVLIHGWPLSADSWDDVAMPLAKAGYQTIAYDRRGFGRSEQPWTGYDYNTMSDDLADVLEIYGAEEATLVGFSMGGGEVARYMSRYDGKRIRSTALIASIVPYMLQTDDHPNGVPKDVFDQILAGLTEDRAAFFASFFKDFFGAGLLTSSVSQQVIEWARSVSMTASLKATLDCVVAFGMTDFRDDLAYFHVPTLIIHGVDDKTVPIDATARVAASRIPSSTLIEYPNAPHGLFATHRDRLINDLLTFLQQN